MLKLQGMSFSKYVMKRTCLFVKYYALKRNLEGT